MQIKATQLIVLQKKNREKRYFMCSSGPTFSVRPLQILGR